MPRDGTKTRLRILDETTQLVLKNGFAGTSIDQILERTQLTKGAFFYHFRNKAELGVQMMEYFFERDMAELQATLTETSDLSENPRARLLAFVQRFIDIYGELETPYAGCLYASYVYEPEQFGSQVHHRVAEALMEWRKVLIRIIEDTAKKHPPATDYNAASLADMFTVVMEGGIITSKAIDDPKVTHMQLIHYRKYLELLFPQ